MDYYTKYLKYKNKYLHLKNLLGGNQDDIPLCHFFIASSHNTYISGNQLTGGVDEKCYTNFIEMYGGGCVEFDPVKVENDDVLISHTGTLVEKLSLRSTLKAIYNSMDKMNKNGTMKGPVILSFDNKDIKGQLQQTLWKIINNTIKDLIYPIKDDFNLATLKLGDCKGKILIKWKMCKKNFDSCKTLIKPRRDSMEFGTDNIWSHLNEDNNESHVAKYDYPTKITDETIKKINETKNKFVTKFSRSYPTGLAVLSKNYSIIPELLHGVQLAALNFQKLDRHTHVQRTFFRDGCMRLKPDWMRDTSKNTTINDFINLTLNISGNNIKRIIVIHPNGKKIESKDNKNIIIRGAHKDFLLFYIICTFTDGTEKWNSFELDHKKLQEPIKVDLHDKHSGMGLTMHCNWEKTFSGSPISISANLDDCSKKCEIPQETAEKIQDEKGDIEIDEKIKTLGSTGLRETTKEDDNATITII